MVVTICAALAIVFVYAEHLRPGSLAMPISYPAVLLVLAAIMGVAAIESIFSAIHFGFGGQSGVSLLGDLILWAGGALMVGGWYLHWAAPAPARQAAASA